MNTADLARTATRAAAFIRAELGISPAEGVCPYDLADRLGVSVRLVALPSLEGMYSSQPRPAIVVSAQRPTGRRRFTCSHELGHHVLKHGTRLDELIDDTSAPWSTEEYMADRFAAALLMPKIAVESAFARRGWRVSGATPERVFVVAQELGVGFTTLVGYLHRSLGQLTKLAAEEHRRVPLRLLRSGLAGLEVEQDVFVFDEHWHRRSLDIEVGDIVILKRPTEFEGSCARLETRTAVHLVATRPGVGTLSLEKRSSPTPVRVSRKGFVGLARYRHLEDSIDHE